jgi:4-hydroxybenzoate polyprenyltransferase
VGLKEAFGWALGWAVAQQAKGLAAAALGAVLGGVLAAGFAYIAARRRDRAYDQELRRNTQGEKSIRALD